MRAITVTPGVANSARLDEVSPPPTSDGAILLRTLALGVCGTDREIIAGEYGTAPPGEKRLVLGHESLGRVEAAPAQSGFAPGDLVVGVVRRPDPVPCPACAAGEWDMCRNGRYVERGIKERNGYGAELFRVEPDFAIKVDPGLGMLGVLVEPTSIVAKAWDHTERIGARSRAWQPHTLLVTGAGPVGLLAALIGAQRGLQMHVFDRAQSGAKPELARALGATYHTGDLGALCPDIVIECTGAGSVVL
ncbi:MAG TPA: alcohol dehydrogenase catalytic domain-containing protein, partial [Xanthobacteraceae bacterium]|nr:alcohol dehydrogenase catalytic domain-containing protein [Xanthobacteraceae bacterium]